MNTRSTDTRTGRHENLNSGVDYEWLHLSSNNFSIKDPAAGASDDWYKGVLKARFVYTVELRDTGFHGFVLPAYQIIPRLLKLGLKLAVKLKINWISSKHFQKVLKARFNKVTAMKHLVNR